MDYHSNGVTGYVFELPYVLVGIQEIDSKYIQLVLVQDYPVDLLDPNEYKVK